MAPDTHVTCLCVSRKFYVKMKFILHYFQINRLYNFVIMSGFMKSLQSYLVFGSYVGSGAGIKGVMQVMPVMLICVEVLELCGF